MTKLQSALLATATFALGGAAVSVLIRITLYLLIADFGYYLAHRLMHTKTLWRTHKWHHFPSYMYWPVGDRATIPQRVSYSDALHIGDTDFTTSTLVGLHGAVDLYLPHQ